MKDFNSNTLALGDFVAFLEPNYRHMVQGRVVGFTPKSIRIEWTVKTYKGTWVTENCLRDPSYVAKIQQKESVELVD